MSTIITDRNPYKQITAGPAAVNLPFDWWVRSEDDMRVLVNGVISTAWTIADADLQNTAGGNIVMDAPFVGGEVVTYLNKNLFDRLSEFTQGGSFRAESINEELAFIISCLQEVRRDMERTMKLSETSTVDPTKFTYQDVPVSGRTLMFIDALGGVGNGPNAADITQAQGYAELAQSWAIDPIGARPQGSAKYWSEQAGLQKDGAEAAATAAAASADAAEGFAEDAQASVGAVKVTINDTTPAVLDSKLLASTNLTKTVGSPGANETLTFDIASNLNKPINLFKGANIASAATADIAAATGNFIHITGTTTITALGNGAQAGTFRHVTFDGVLTLTHNATSLILPGGANIVTAAGDTAAFVSEGSNNWRCLGYTRANGGAIRVVGTFAANTANTNITGAASVMAIDAAAPAVTEGVEILSCSVTPSSPTAELRATAYVTGYNSGGVGSYSAIALFAGSTFLNGGQDYVSSSRLALNLFTIAGWVPGSVSPVTVSVRVGGATSGNSIVLNANQTFSGGIWLGNQKCILVVEEVTK